MSEKNATLEAGDGRFDALVMLAWPLIKLAKLWIFRIRYYLALLKTIIALWYETNLFNTDLFYTS